MPNDKGEKMNHDNRSLWWGFGALLAIMFALYVATHFHYTKIINSSTPNDQPTVNEQLEFAKLIASSMVQGNAERLPRERMKTPHEIAVYATQLSAEIFDSKTQREAHQERVGSSEPKQ